MFASPPIVEAECFARLPRSLRNGAAARRNAARFGREHDSFLEGPSFDSDGRLHVVDIVNGRVLRVSDRGEFTVVCEYDGMPCGLKFDKDGRMVIADFKRGLVEIDPRSGEPNVLVERLCQGEFHGLNDLIFSSDGDLYFTDQGSTDLRNPYGRLVRRRRDGRLEVLLDNVPSPNGVALSPDESVLYLAVTRANSVWRVPLGADGSMGRVGTFIQLSGGLAGPDGLAVDETGSLLVAHCGLGAVWLFSRLGEPLLRIRSTLGLLTTNVAYDVANPTELCITESESGSILRAKLEVPGLALYGTPRPAA